jgi:hypothetical protein
VRMVTVSALGLGVLMGASVGLVSGIWVGWWSRPGVVWVSAWGGVVWCGSRPRVVWIEEGGGVVWVTGEEKGRRKEK